MKVVVLLIVFGAITSVRVLGQGSFDFTNLGSGINSPVFDSAGNRLEGPQYRAAMYAGLTEASLQFVADTPFLAGNLAGFFDGGYVFVQDLHLGFAASVQVVAWDTTLGSTFEAAKSRGLGGYGEAKIFQVTVGGGGTPPFPWTDFQSFSLLPIVPEPGSFWILAAGLPLFWFARRRKR
jgi:hypothetical protein